MLLKVITTIAVTVAVHVLAAQRPDPGEESNGIAIPLTKRSDTDAREFYATSHNTKIMRDPNGMDDSEDNMGTPHSSALQRDGVGAGLGLSKFTDGVWYATIHIGTPPMPFTVHLNTGFSDLFVAASSSDPNVRSHSSVWDPTSSQNTEIDFEVLFADGRFASGKQYLNNVTIAGFTADSQTIGAATIYSPSMEATQFGPDGVLGLAFPSASIFSGQSPLFHTLFNERKLSQPVFSLNLTKFGGELYIGGMNRALYVQDTLVYTPVTHPVLWQLMIDDIRVNDKIILRNVLAIVDTGSNYIIGLEQEVFQLHTAGGGGIYEGDHHDFYYVYPCKGFPTVTFTIGGRPFTLSPDVLNLGRAVYRSRSCKTGIVTVNTNTNFWSIGTIFLEQFYTVFDFDSRSPRVGFAQLAR